MAWIFITGGLLLIVGAVIFLLYYYEKSSSDPRDRVNALDSRYDPNITPLRARREANRSKARTEVAAQLVEETKAVADLVSQKTATEQVIFQNEHINEHLDRQEQLNKERHTNEIEDLILQRNLIKQAQVQGMDVDTYLEILKIRALNTAEIQKIEAQAHAQLKAGFIYQLQEYQRLAMLRDNLDSLYERAYLIESGGEPEPVKRRKLTQIEEDIKLHEEDIKHRRKGLLQTHNGEEVPGRDETTDTEGHS